MSTRADFGWGSVARMGLVQACLGSIVVLTTSTLNRVMVVELALPALLPGVLVALHYLVQVSRPRMGHGSDVGGRRTPWILGGMVTLAAGGVLATLATMWMATQALAGTALAVLAFVLIGLGVSASGTSLLVLLAKRVPQARRGPAATLVWVMMIVGFAVTAGTAGKLLDPYTPMRLLAVTSSVCAIAVCVTALALWGLEGPAHAGTADEASAQPAKPGFREALVQVWGESAARHFTIFVFVSMLAYSAQDLILEPFAGSVFGFTPGESTQLSGVQHGGVLAGMLLVALSGVVAARWPQVAALKALGSLKGWTVGGCVASALALAGLAAAGVVGPGWPLGATVFALGVANGAFSIGAIGSMMQLANEGRESREGVRMGLWGAAQAVAFGIGGVVGTAASDIARWWIADGGTAYALVFSLEALLFIASAALAWRIGQNLPAARTGPAPQRYAPSLDHR
ncbi:MAG: BCD family MFS transporter [Burkholderiaceae bacterium]